MSVDESVPESEADWQPLRNAFTDALWNQEVILPKRVEVALVAAVCDLLDGEGVTLTEAET
jgi:hypothetical protein